MDDATDTGQETTGTRPATESGGDTSTGGPQRAARTALLAGVFALAVLVVAAVLAAAGAGRDTGEDAGGTRGERPEDIVVVETPVPLDERVPPARRQALPDLVLDGFDGAEPVELAAYRGQPLVVNLWASWCAPCIEEMPDIEQVARELEGRVVVLGVNTRDAPANAVAFADELGITYDLAADPQGELFEEIGSFGMPTTVFVDPGGTIVYRHVGLLDADGLRALVAERLGVDVSGAAGWRLGASLG